MTPQLAEKWNDAVKKAASEIGELAGGFTSFEFCARQIIMKHIEPVVEEMDKGKAAKG